MLSPPEREPRCPPLGATVHPVGHITLSFYRYLYNSVGADWNWHDRRTLADDSLDTLIHAPGLEIHVLWQDGCPAGFCELDFSVVGQVKLVYFGLLPEFIGRGLGGYFLDWSVARMWRPGVERVWVHTCTLDHPAALAQYQKAGFYAYQTTVEDNRYLRRPTA